jgi:vacuolar protein sorting-associated protein 13A/C
VYDGTKEGTKHRQIVAVKADKTGEHSALGPISPMDERPGDLAAPHPFFYAKFENNPLDQRADTGLTVKLRYMEIFYHAGYIEAIVAFFKPPESQLESVAALVDVASETLEGLRKETRAGLEYALQNHKTVDLRVDMNAPIIIIPEDITKDDCVHMVVDAGRIIITSDLADQQAMDVVRQKQQQKYSEEDWERLESLMYDKFHVELRDTQVRSF